MNRSFLFLAEGFEEIEALATVDVLRRAGMDLKTVSITDKREVAGAHGIVVTSDMTFAEADFAGAEWLIAPGGMPGASNLAAFEPLCELLKAHEGKIAAICAAPAVVLAPLGLLDGLKATCYPGFEEALAAGGAEKTDVRVEVTERIITANGPSSALPFALAIVAASLGESVAQEVGAGMLLYPGKMEYYF